jgi:signal transduction histidine kinase
MDHNKLQETDALPEKVLIVDDNPMNRKLLRATLEAENINIYEAGDGIEALAVLEQDTVEAVISDILMPNMDGYQLCHELRCSQKFHSLPLIVYTNTYTSPGDRELALALGVDEYITKPAAAEEICAALRRAKARSVQQPGVSPSDLGDDFTMKKYANVLVRKLEKKNLELEKTRAELEQINRELDRRVRERTAQLEAANKELDSFCHSISHDLRAPVRHISGFAGILKKEHLDHLDDHGRSCLEHILDSVGRMGELINDLLNLSRFNRLDMAIGPVDLSALAHRAANSLRRLEPERQAEVVIADGMSVQGDARLLLIVLENLLGNAWKFTSKRSRAHIEVGLLPDAPQGKICFVRDNGAGFDMQYAGKLFGTFQRLHDQNDFAGTGVGLATVQRIIHRHGGCIWAEAVVNKGATFYFTLESSVRPKPGSPEIVLSAVPARKKENHADPNHKIQFR